MRFVMAETARQRASRERGARIKELRERHPPGTQEPVARKLGMGLRNYQRIEKRGTNKWDHVEALADYFDVDAYWLWEGEERSEVPEVMDGALKAQLDSIESTVEETLAILKDQLAAERVSRAGVAAGQATRRVQTQKARKPAATRRARGRAPSGS